MLTCYAAKTKGTLTQVPCQVKAPAKKNTKTPTARPSAVQQGNPGSSLKVITGGKSQAKTAAKGGAIVFAEDKLQARPKLSAKEAAAKKTLARNFINDFGMIKVAKDDGKKIKPSVWGSAKLQGKR